MARQKSGNRGGVCRFCGTRTGHLYYGYCDGCSYERWKRWLRWQNRIIKRFERGHAWRVTKLEQPLYELAEGIEELKAELDETVYAARRDDLAKAISHAWRPVEGLIERYNNEGYEVYSVLLGDRKMAFRVRRPPKR